MNPLILDVLDNALASDASRPHFHTPSLGRESAGRAIEAILWAYGTLNTDTSSVYAYDASPRALNIDWAASNIVYCRAIELFAE